MTWIEIILLALKMFGPLIVELIQKLIEKLHKLPREERVEARTAIFHALKTGNEDHVKAVIGHWHKRCMGVACPMDTVGE